MSRTDTNPAQNMLNFTDLGHEYKLPECYIYFYHTEEYFILPQYPEAIDDYLSTLFQNETPLSRTAPIYTYSNSGPREVSFSLSLHRDMLNNVNVDGSNVQVNLDSNVITPIKSLPADIDYMDLLIRKLQSVALPRYNASEKTVDPPRVAIRLANEVFIKGVVTSGIKLQYKLPLLSNGKYAQATISFTVAETTPYDADNVWKDGSFRGITSGKSIENKIAGK